MHWAALLDYLIWKPIMEDLLYCKDLHKSIESRSAKPRNVSDGDWEKLNRKAIGRIRQWVDPNIFYHIS